MSTWNNKNLDLLNAFKFIVETMPLLDGKPQISSAGLATQKAMKFGTKLCNFWVFEIHLNLSM